jgi:hypothetical protein
MYALQMCWRYRKREYRQKVMNNFILFVQAEEVYWYYCRKTRRILLAWGGGGVDPSAKKRDGRENWCTVAKDSNRIKEAGIAGM